MAPTFSKLLDTSRVNKTLVLRVRVAEEYTAGSSTITGIAASHGVSRGFVRKWGERFANHQPLGELKKGGRKPTLGEREVALLFALMRDPRLDLNTAAELHDALCTRVPGLVVSVRTVRRTLKAHGAKFLRPSYVRVLTPTHVERRLAFVRAYHSVSPWSATMFTDSTMIYSGEARAGWSLPGDTHCFERPRKGLKVHVYAGVTYHGRTRLYFATGTTGQAPYTAGARGVTGEEYREQVVLGLFIPEAARIFGARQWHFVQDGAAPHTAGPTVQLLVQHMSEQWIRDWPPNSADLNPIENVWSLLKRRVRGTRYSTIAEFKAAVTDAWAAIPQSSIRVSVGSVCRRLRAVVQEKGGRIPY